MTKAGDKMFREMRRKGQQLSTEDCEAILNRGTSGVLAVSGDGEPENLTPAPEEIQYFDV